MSCTRARGARLLRAAVLPVAVQALLEREPRSRARKYTSTRCTRCWVSRSSGVHPTWEVELSTATLPFLADHRVQGTTVWCRVPCSSRWPWRQRHADLQVADYAVDDLVLHRALILDDFVRSRSSGQRSTRTGGTLEFAAFTATAGGDFKWTVTATAELNTLPPRHRPRRDPERTPSPSPPIDGDEFYARTRAIGFAYGDAFQIHRPVIASGDGWAISRTSPSPHRSPTNSISYRFHPALIDGAFQTLFGTPFVGRRAQTTAPVPSHPNPAQRRLRSARRRT